MPALRVDSDLSPSRASRNAHERQRASEQNDIIAILKGHVFRINPELSRKHKFVKRDVLLHGIKTILYLEQKCRDHGIKLPFKSYEQYRKEMRLPDELRRFEGKLPTERRSELVPHGVEDEEDYEDGDDSEEDEEDSRSRQNSSASRKRGREEDRSVTSRGPSYSPGAPNPKKRNSDTTSGTKLFKKSCRIVVGSYAAERAAKKKGTTEEDVDPEMEDVELGLAIDTFEKCKHQLAYDEVRDGCAKMRCVHFWQLNRLQNEQLAKGTGEELVKYMLTSTEGECAAARDRARHEQDTEHEASLSPAPELVAEDKVVAAT
ncbi:unnamed protein product, partial [Mesorhabditis spiculigera]